MTRAGQETRMRAGWAALLADALARQGYRTAYQVLRLWWRVRRPRVRGAAVAAWSADGRLLVVRSSYRGHLVDLPGGGAAAGETARAAALRELAEETGLAAPPAGLVEVLRLAHEEDGRRILDTVLEWRPPAPAAALSPAVDRREIVWAAWCEEAELARLAPAPVLRQYLAWRLAQPPSWDKGMRGQPDGRTATPAGPRAR